MRFERERTRGEAVAQARVVCACVCVCERVCVCAGADDGAMSPIAGAPTAPYVPRLAEQHPIVIAIDECGTPCDDIV